MSNTYRSNGRSSKVRPAQQLALVMLLATITLMLMAPNTGAAAANAPDLGTAGSFGALAGSAVTNTGSTTIDGDVGVSPGSSVTGFPPGTLTGTIHAADAVALQAQNDANSAYNDAAGQACDFSLTGQNLGGMTLIPGVYCFTSSAQLTGKLILDGQGNSNSIFIFKIGSTLITASNSGVNTINGAEACNVFWQVGSSATLGTNTSFAGNILAFTSITLNTGASTGSGLYAHNGAVTLDSNDVTSCDQPQVPIETPTITSTSTTTATNVPLTNTPTSTSISTATSTSTSTGVPATGTSIPAATNTQIPGANTPTNSPTSVPAATNTPTRTATERPESTRVPDETDTPTNTMVPEQTPASTNTVVAEDTVVANETATAAASATNSALSTATTNATEIAINTPSGTTTSTAIETGTPTSTVMTATTTSVVGTATKITTAIVTITASSTGTIVSGTATMTQVTTVPTTIPRLPRTGGTSPWDATFVLWGSLSLFLLVIGLASRLTIRKAYVRVGQQKFNSR